MLKLGIIININLPKINRLIKELDNKFLIKHYSSLPPHISIYIWESEPELNVMIKEIKTIAAGFKVFSLQTNKLNFSKYNTIQLEITKNLNLNKFHKIIVERISKFRDKTAHSKAIEFYHSFNKKEIMFIEKYGRPNLLSNFDPHITLEKFQPHLASEVKGFLSNFKPKFKIEISEFSLLEMRADNYKIIKKFKLDV